MALNRHKAFSFFSSSPSNRAVERIAIVGSLAAQAIIIDQVSQYANRNAEHAMHEATGVPSPKSPKRGQ